MEIIHVTVRTGEHELTRAYQIIDGQAPDNMQENIQELVDTLLDHPEPLTISDVVVLSEEDEEELTEQKRREEAEQADRIYNSEDTE